MAQTVKVKSDWNNPENAFVDISQQTGIVTENLCPYYGTEHTIEIRKGFLWFVDRAKLKINRTCDSLSYRYIDEFKDIPKIGSIVRILSVSVAKYGLD